ncbi:peroxidase 5 [Tanacetum coccineum]
MAESIVKDEVSKSYSQDSGLAAGVGCDGSVLIDSTPSNIAEKDSPVNNPSLRGFNVIDNAKARLEEACPGVVSCADIVAFAARDGIQITGGYGYDVPAGRRDGVVSLAAETIGLPPPTFNLSQLTQSFASNGLTQEEMVTLSGTHTIGRAHCTSFANRLYTFSSSVNQDPSLDASYASSLKQQCPDGGNDVNLVVPMDPSSPAITDTEYYVDVLNNRGLFTSDQTLLTSASTANQVYQNAIYPSLWKSKLADAMVKMGKIGVITEAQLQVGFYSRSCSEAESIVKDEVSKAFSQNKGLAAALVRLHFHDCFVRGCDGSVLIDSTSSNTAEKDSPANNPSLRGFNVIDNAKTRLEKVCPGVVSCADIVAFAARDGFQITGGLEYDVPAGRRDGRVSLIAETVGLPPPTSNLNQLTQVFSSNGLTQEDMVTLSGAHTIGRSHCTSFVNRLYNFSSSAKQDPTLDKSYASKLKQQCPKGSNNVNLVVPMNPSSPAISDTGYYVDVLDNKGLFTSDQSLLTSKSTANQVHQNARDPYLWKSKFAKAMVKMGKNGVLTGIQGEIRKNCRVINKCKVKNKQENLELHVPGRTRV